MAKSAKKVVKTETEFGPVQLKVSDKGCLSVYGIRRFPISFYKSEWLWLFSKEEAIRDYMERHDDDLKQQVEGGGKAVEGAEVV